MKHYSLINLKCGELFKISPENREIYQFTGRSVWIGKKNPVVIYVCKQIVPFMDTDIFFEGDETIVYPIEIIKSKEISEDNEITEAIKLFQKEINTNEDFYRSYKANIAICLYDSKAGSIVQCNQYAEDLMQRIFK